MTNQSTIDKLIEMRLTAMSDAFLNQMNDPKLKEISFEDRFAMLEDIEYSNRKGNSLKRLIRNAAFDQPEAYIEDINYYCIQLVIRLYNYRKFLLYSIKNGIGGYKYAKLHCHPDER